MSIFRFSFIRWKYVLPRLVILLIVGLAFRFGLDPALKWAIVTGGESSVGAKVELASVETSLWDGELVLKNFAIANPQSPMRNLLESDESRLQLDVNALLHGRVVVIDGIVRGLQFDTDRETSGALAEVEAEEDTGPSAIDPMLDMASLMGEKWLDDLGDRLDVDIVDQLQSPRLAKELETRWPQQYEQLQQQVKNIRERGKTLQKDIREVKGNPLRGLQKLPALQQQVAQLQQEVQSVQQQIGNLPQQAEADRQAVLAAREQDEALLRQKLKFGSLDGEGLTQTLLGEPVNDQLVSALGWIRWAREQLPSSGVKPKKLRGRGTTVLFTPPRPDYLVKRLQLEGLAQLSGEPLLLTGTLTGASSAPHLLDEPMRLELKGSEALDLNVEIELDRRGEVARDRLWLTCPQLAMAGRTLGNADKLAIEMGEGVANFRVELSLIGNQLDGKIVFAQESLKLTPRLAKSPKGQLAEVLNQALAGVQRLEANVTLVGTLKKPQIKIDSDIGSQVATGLNSSVQQLFKQRTDGLLAKSRAQVDAQLQKLTAMREKAQQDLLAQLGEGQELLGQLTALAGGGKGLPGGIPQLGKSLRLDGLLKK
ncbi:MAG: TIGR03545 family protein [Planctomycetes bacterium]|nr:TIGR03545 family protein [Planctomycetota bacterium]